MLWLLYLAWSSHLSLTLIALLLLLSAVVNDTRYLYDSKRLRLHYAIVAPLFLLLLLILDAVADAGILERYARDPDYVVSVLAVLGVGALASQFIIATVGGQWRSLDEQVAANNGLTRRLAVLNAEHAAVKHASDFMLYGLSAGRFTHDVASPLSSLKMSVSQLRQLNQKGDDALETEILGTLDAALEQLDEQTRSFASAIRSRPKTYAEDIEELLPIAVQAARETGAKRDGASEFVLELELEPSNVWVCAEHRNALGDLIANAARASAAVSAASTTGADEYIVNVTGKQLTDELYEVCIRD